MAPPSKRRPGFSRRAQYGLFLGYVVAVAGVMFAILLLVVAIVDPKGFAGLRGLALDVTTPVSSAGRSVVRGVADAGSAIGDYFLAGSQNAALRRELKSTHQALIAARATELENQRLKRLLKLSGTLVGKVTTARIVSSSFESSRRLATLDAGAASGVEVGMPVRAPEGLIGRIVEAGRHASRVLLITDGASNTPVQLVRDGTPALATGKGDGTLDLKPLELGENPFKAGDVLVTSGVGGIYEPGIPVALVVAVDHDQTVARPIADPARIDFAIVQRIYQGLAGRALVPAAPGTAP